MPKDFCTLEDSNRSSNPSLHEVSDPARRTLLHGDLGLVATAFFAGMAACAGTRPRPASPMR